MSLLLSHAVRQNLREAESTGLKETDRGLAIWRSADFSQWPLGALLPQKRPADRTNLT